jgi:hypothetical protein
MAAEFVALRDGIKPAGQLLPPGQTVQTDYSKTPVHNAGSFLVSAKELPHV